jgi:hypothetical protein
MRKTNLRPLFSSSLDTSHLMLSPGVGVTTVVALSGRINLQHVELKIYPTAHAVSCHTVL